MDDVIAFRNDLFTRICFALQLTEKQFLSAERAYETVGELLGADERLAKLHPRIYPQGSMALLTTVRPRGRVEYDLDMVLEVDGIEGMTPKWLYVAVKDCLEPTSDIERCSPHARAVSDLITPTSFTWILFLLAAIFAFDRR